MRLITENGHLKLSSAYRLIVTAWIISFGCLVGLILVLSFLITLISGQTTVNGEIVYGRSEALLQMLPFFILFPVIITFHAFMFGGFPNIWPCGYTKRNVQ